MTTVEKLAHKKAGGKKGKREVKRKVRNIVITASNTIKLYY